MSWKVIVSDNCQTGGIVATLQNIFPEHNICAAPIPSFASLKDEEAFVRETLASADLWITSDRFDLTENHKGSVAKTMPRVVKIPMIVFGAFHPDLVYVKNRQTNTLTKEHYNSKICAWAYKNGLSTDEACRLFNAEVFRKLGYFSLWTSEVESLSKRFAATDINFGDFFLNVKRRGVFMHSRNHPNIEAISRLGKLLAISLGAPASVLHKPMHIPDGLSGASWPLYPEIAMSFSLDGGAYEWVLDNKCYDLNAYSNLAYESYSAQGFKPQSMEICCDETILDDVLTSCVGDFA